MKKRILNCALYLCLLLGVIPVSVFAADGGDVTYKGLSFLENIPTERTQYTAGNGTVEFIPAANGEKARIILNNAVLNEQCNPNLVSLTIAAADNKMQYEGITDVDLELIGQNTVKEISGKNIHITGDGSLTTGRQISVECLTGRTENLNAFVNETKAEFLSNTHFRSDSHITVYGETSLSFYTEYFVGKDLKEDQGVISEKTGRLTIMEGAVLTIPYLGNVSYYINVSDPSYIENKGGQIVNDNKYGGICLFVPGESSQSQIKTMIGQ